MTVPSGSLPLAPTLLDRGLVHDPSLYRAADGTVEATLPVDDLLTGLGAVRVFRLPATGGSTPAADAATSSRAPSGPAPGAATAAGSAIAVSGPTGIELYAGGTRTAPAALRPSDGTDCSALAPSLAAAGGRMWLAWSAALCGAQRPAGGGRGSADRRRYRRRAAGPRRADEPRCSRRCR